MPLADISPLAVPSLEAERTVLWDVVEEHLDEAQFGLEQLDALRSHPRLTLADVTKYPEARLLAHLDALVIGGEAIVERVLAPPVAEPDPEALARTTAAAFVLAQLGRYDVLAPALGHALPAARSALARGLAHSGHARALPWARDRLEHAASDAERSGALEVIAAMRAEPPPVLQWLQSDDAALVASATRAGLCADPQRHLPVMEYLLEHPARDVRETALLAALCWGSSRSFAVCERMALDESASSAPAMALYAVLGGPAQHARLAERLAQPAARNAALFALGYSGAPALLPALLEHLRSDDPLTSKLAAQAIAMITGLDLNDEAFARPAAPDATAESEAKEELEALPALEDDDLGADLAPAPEAALELPDAHAITRACEQLVPQLDPKRRFLGGRPYGPDTVLDALERGPMRRRETLALAFAIGTAGQAWIDTRAFSAEQRAQIAAARALGVRSIGSGFG